MAHEKRRNETTFGYLSTVHSAEHGFFGGYLIVCCTGRPLEFHCTSPVRPSRAQEILYGPTLQPYLIGEQIGGTLLRAAKLTPPLLLTDRIAMLALRQQAGVLMAHVPRASNDELTEPGMPQGIASSVDASGRRETARPSPSSDGPIADASYELQLPPGFESERGAVTELIALAAQHVDLIEPFSRIHEAIREAQRIGGRTQEGHDQAA